jgi:hypothetical protein
MGLIELVLAGREVNHYALTIPARQQNLWPIVTEIISTTARNVLFCSPVKVFQWQESIPRENLFKQIQGKRRLKAF